MCMIYKSRIQLLSESSPINVGKILPKNPNHIVSLLGQDEGYTVKYNPLPEGVPKGKAGGNS